MIIHSRITLLLLAGFAVALSVQSANASVQVGTCAPANRVYSTIQSAVNAVVPGGTVQICPGSYPEEVMVTQSVTLTSVPGQQGSVNIVAPTGGFVPNTTYLDGTPIIAQIAVVPSAPAVVNIKNLVVNGAGNNATSCAFDYVGIYYQNASGTIGFNTAENQLLPPALQGCQDGQGIFVENANPATVIHIQGNTVSNFDKNGITLNGYSGSGGKGTVESNSVTGLGPTDVIAQNGIQVGFGATATVSLNNVSNLIYTPDTYGSSGILLYDIQAANYIARPAVTKNSVSSAQYGIALDAVNGVATSLVQVTGNTLLDSQFAGVGLYSDNGFASPLSDDYINVANNLIFKTAPYDGIDACSDNNNITGNTVTGSGGSSTESGIHLDDQCVGPGGPTGIGNTATSNHLGYSCAGILSGPGAGANTITRNTYSNVSYQILYNTDSCTPPGHRLGGGKSRVSGGPARAVQPVTH